jgi:hypothetical protein
MSHTVSALPLIVCLSLAAGAVHAQSDAYLYVGADGNQQNRAFGTATVSASGTAAAGRFEFINADPSTTDYKGLSAFGTGQITVTGGTFQQLLADDSSVINLVGSSLTQSQNFYFDSQGNSWYTVSGILQQDQTPFTAQWYRPSTGTLEFNGAPAVPGAAPVPEVSTIISFGLLLTGAAWLAVKRRKVTA